MKVYLPRLPQKCYSSLDVILASNHGSTSATQTRCFRGVTISPTGTFHGRTSAKPLLQISLQYYHDHIVLPDQRACVPYESTFGYLTQPCPWHPGINIMILVQAQNSRSIDQTTCMIRPCNPLSHKNVVHPESPYFPYTISMSSIRLDPNSS